MATTGGGDDDATGSSGGPNGLQVPPATEPGATPLAGMGTIRSTVSNLETSTVALTVSGPGGTSTSTGLVAESGGMIVTSAPALAAARSITVIESDGVRRPATLVASDEGSGLAVIRIDDDLPAADFQGADPTVGKTVVAMAFDPARRTGASPDARLYAGTVTAGTTPVSPSAPDDLATIAVTAPLSAGDVGCPLIGSDGGVSGLLEHVSRIGSSVVSAFLPAQLVLGVAQQLVSSGQVDHGWLGVIAGDAGPSTVTTSSTLGRQPSSPAGALLESVETGSPAAAGGLEPGDVITGISIGTDTVEIHSAAELGAALYAVQPGTSVDVTYQDGTSGPLSTWVTLSDDDASSPSSAP